MRNVKLGITTEQLIRCGICSLNLEELCADLAVANPDVSPVDIRQCVFEAISDLKLTEPAFNQNQNIRQALRTYREQLARAAYAACGGKNYARAARMCGFSRSYMHRLLTKERQAGSVLVESIFLVPLLALTFLMGWDISQLCLARQDTAYIVAASAECINKVGCDPVQLAFENSNLLGLNTHNLQVVQNGKQITVTYLCETAFIHRPGYTFSTSAVAP